MEQQKYGAEYGFQTRAVHTGNEIDRETGAIKRPITMANSYALPYDPTDMNWSRPVCWRRDRHNGSRL